MASAALRAVSRRVRRLERRLAAFLFRRVLCDQLAQCCKFQITPALSQSLCVGSRSFASSALRTEDKFPPYLLNVPATEVATLGNGVRVATEVRSCAERERCVTFFVPFFAGANVCSMSMRCATVHRMAWLLLRFAAASHPPQRQRRLHYPLPLSFARRAATARRPPSVSSLTPAVATRPRRITGRHIFLSI